MSRKNNKLRSVMHFTADFLTVLACFSLLLLALCLDIIITVVRRRRGRSIKVTPL